MCLSLSPLLRSVGVLAAILIIMSVCQPGRNPLLLFPLPPIFQSVPVDAPSRVQYWKARKAEAAAAKAMKQRPFRSCGATFSGRSDAADESGSHKEGEGGGSGGRRHQGTGLIEKSTELTLKHVKNGPHRDFKAQPLTQLFAY